MTATNARLRAVVVASAVHVEWLTALHGKRITILDWSGGRHASRTRQSCHYCNNPFGTHLRDDDGRPAHKMCAELHHAAPVPATVHRDEQPAEQGQIVTAPRSTLDAALSYAARGWPVFPCKTTTKEPATPTGFYDASTDPEWVRYWFGTWPDLNVAIRTGYPGPDVLDIDVRRTGTGWAALHRLNRAGLLAGAQRLVRTPSTGLHAYFVGTGQPCGRLKAHHVDLKATGGYVLAPPSYVITDDYSGPYVHVGDRDASLTPLDWSAVSALLVPQRSRRAATGPVGDMDALVRTVAQAEEGNRNNLLFWACCRAVDDGAADLDALAPLINAVVSAGLPEVEAGRTARSALRRAGGAA
jgi:hypothetical protein